MAGKYLDTELNVKTIGIPHDQLMTGIEGEQISLYDPYRAIDRRDLKDLDNNEALIRILRNTDIDIMLRTIGNAFFPRVITVGTFPTLLIAPNRTPRGYILMNANTSVTGITTPVTAFGLGTVFPIGTTNSADINVSGYESARIILDVTEGSTGPVSVNILTQDPLSGNFAVAQSDIFQFGLGAVEIGTYYANLGSIGVDSVMRVQVVVAGVTMTGSVSSILKPALASSIAGATAFIGGPDVNTTIGYPLLSGTKETFYLKENTALYGVSTGAINLNVFELQ